MTSEMPSWKAKLARLINEENPTPMLDYNPKVLVGWICFIFGGFGLFLSVFIALGTTFSTLKLVGIGKKEKLSLILTSFPFLLPFLAIAAILFGFWMLKRSGYNFQKNRKLLLGGSVILIVLTGIFVYTTKLYKDPTVANPKTVIKELKKGDVQDELRQDFWGNLDKNLQQMREKAN